MDNKKLLELYKMIMSIEEGKNIIRATKHGHFKIENLGNNLSEKTNNIVFIDDNEIL